MIIRGWMCEGFPGLYHREPQWAQSNECTRHLVRHTRRQIVGICKERLIIINMSIFTYLTTLEMNRSDLMENCPILVIQYNIKMGAGKKVRKKVHLLTRDTSDICFFYAISNSSHKLLVSLLTPGLGFIL